MAFEVLMCPNCKGHLQADTRSGIAECPFCKTQINMVQRAFVTIDGIPGLQSYLDRGEMLYRSGKIEEANAAYKDAIKIDPQNCEAHYGRYLCEMSFAEYYRFRDEYGNSGPIVEANIRSNLLRQYLIPAADFAMEPLKSQLSVMVDEEIRTIENLSNSSSSPAGSSGCYIATAVYGSYYDPQVIRLRYYRDTVLQKTAAGRLFIKIYYAISPSLAKHLKAGHPVSEAVRKILDKYVEMINR